MERRDRERRDRRREIQGGVRLREGGDMEVRDREKRSS